MKINITENTRKSLFASLEGAYHKEGDFIEVTEWSNGEGYDVTINEKQFSLHFTEYEALKKIIKKFEKE
jgi:hypothetical protein